MDPITQIKQQMLALSREQLEKVREYATVLLLDAPATASNALNSTHDLALTIICEVMRSHAADFSSPAMLQQSPQFKSFANKLDRLVLYLQHTTDKNRIAMRALLYLATELLYTNLTQMGVPISSRTLMAHYHRLPAVLNAAFPGYAESGLLSMVIRKEEACSARMR